MIISASRRTDIPAFYAKWFMARISAGFCSVPNPYNPKQISRISLKPDDVDVIIFWTRYAAPLMPFLGELDQRGYRYYFLYTIMNNPRALDRRKVSHQRSLRTFQALSNAIGKERVIWRYDPVVFTQKTDLNFHMETYQRIAEALKGYTRRSIVSQLDVYRKLKARLNALADKGMKVIRPNAEDLRSLLSSMARSARDNDMEIQSCAEKTNFKHFGISPGKCIDDHLIQDVFHFNVATGKDASQRKECRCVPSRDIGVYDTCRFECVYCYATSSFDRARERHRLAKLDSPFLSNIFSNKLGAE